MKVTAANVATQDSVRQRLLPAWQTRVATLLDEHPDLAEDVRRLVRQINAQLPAVQQTWVHNVTAHGHSTTFSVQHGDQHIHYHSSGTPAETRRGRRIGKAGKAAIGIGGGAGAAGGFALARRLFPRRRSTRNGQPRTDTPHGTGTPTTSGETGTPAPGLAPGSAPAASTAAVSSVTKVIIYTAVAVVGGGVISVGVYIGYQQLTCDAAIGDRAATEVVTDAANQLQRSTFDFSITVAGSRVTGSANSTTKFTTFTVETGDQTSAGRSGPTEFIIGGQRRPPGTRTDDPLAYAARPQLPADLLAFLDRADHTSGCDFTGTLAAPASAATFDATIDTDGNLTKVTITWPAPSDSSRPPNPQPSGRNGSVVVEPKCASADNSCREGAPETTPTGHRVDAQYTHLDVAADPPSPVRTATSPEEAVRLFLSRLAGGDQSECLPLNGHELCTQMGNEAAAAGQMCIDEIIQHDGGYLLELSKPDRVNAHVTESNGTFTVTMYGAPRVVERLDPPAPNPRCLNLNS